MTWYNVIWYVYIYMYIYIYIYIWSNILSGWCREFLLFFKLTIGILVKSKDTENNQKILINQWSWKWTGTHRKLARESELIKNNIWHHETFYNLIWQSRLCHGACTYDTIVAMWIYQSSDSDLGKIKLEHTL